MEHDDPLAKAVDRTWYVRMQNEAVARERERCAKIAEQLSACQALEVGGKRLMLGSMASNPCDAQKLTAEAIAAAIRVG